MSSTADSLSSQPDSAEPNAKRAKIDDNQEEAKSKVAADNNNGASDKVAGENNNVAQKQSDGPAGGSGTVEAKEIPTKAAANGTDKSGVSENDAEAREGEDLDFEDPLIADRLSQVEEIQSQISKLNEQASEEILKVEQKFNKLRRPHFEKRNSILKEIPNFWLTTLANHPIIAQYFEHEPDEDCLHYMTNLDVEELEDIKSGYNLKFYFKENPYIENDLIVREIRHLSSEEVITGTTGIEFKATPQGEKLREIVEHCISQERRKMRPEEMQSSFFAWLSQQQTEPGQDEIAEIIKDQIWPSPMEYFFINPEDYGDGSDDDDDDDSEDDEEDYDDGIENEMPEIGDEEELEGEEFDEDDEEEEDDDDLEEGEEEGEEEE